MNKTNSIRIYLISTAFLVLFLLFISVLGVSAQNPQSGSAGLSGTVPADPPDKAATITLPPTGQTITRTPITVQGVCTAGLLVKIFKNQVFAGSVVCGFTGSYSIELDLFSGTNELIAKIFDALEQPGPDSNLVVVTYDDSSQNRGAEKLLLTSNFATRGADPGQQLNWPLAITGGIAPYAVSVDWGDGNTSVVSLEFAGNFQIDHEYEQPGTYKIIVKASDSTGDTAFLQLVGVGNGLLEGKLDTGADQTVISRSIWVIWPLYVMLFFIVSTFWLGRRYEVKRIRSRLEKNQRVF